MRRFEPIQAKSASGCWWSQLGKPLALKPEIWEAGHLENLAMCSGDFWCNVATIGFRYYRTVRIPAVIVLAVE